MPEEADLKDRWEKYQASEQPDENPPEPQEPRESLIDHLARCQHENLPEYQQAVSYLCARYISSARLDGWCTQLFGYLLSGQIEPAKESARLFYQWHRKQLTDAGATHSPETLEEAYSVYVAQMFASRAAFEGETIPYPTEAQTIQ